MATKISLVVVILFFDVLVVYANASNSSTRFTLQLIPPTSPDSPFYQSIDKYLTSIDRRRQSSKSQLSNQTYSHGNNVRIPLRFQDPYYVTRVQLGDPGQLYTLVVDTGSELSWTQCQPCRMCYPQHEPIFNPAHSQTYFSLPCSHPLCHRRSREVMYGCVDDRCVYDMVYDNGARTQGFASWESFGLPNSDRFIHTVHNVIFGCSDYTHGFGPSISGALGMNAGPASLTTQLSMMTNDRFSYCLRPFEDGDNSLIKFGDDIEIGVHQTTPLNIVSPSPQYQLTLIDIEVSHHRLNIPSSYFALRPDGSGGCWLDTESIPTYLPPSAYYRLKEVIQDYFDSTELYRVTNVPEGLAICYQYKPEFEDYPTMSYIFYGAVMLLPVENTYLFRKSKGYFCLPTLPSNDGATIIGTVNQHNIKFVFDRRRRELMFLYENCADDRV